LPTLTLLMRLLLVALISSCGHPPSSWAQPAGISGASRQIPVLSRFLLHTGTRGRGNPATGAAHRVRCGHSVQRHPGYSRCPPDGKLGGDPKGMVNAALDLLNARIVSMRPGDATLTVVFPLAADPAALRQKQRSLDGAPGIRYLDLATTLAPEILPPAPTPR